MKRRILLFFMILLIVLNAQVWVQNTQIFSEKKLITPQSDVHLVKSSLQRLSSIQYEDHDPISIDGNADFSNQATAEGWLGDGTASNPYVINGYNISLLTREWEYVEPIKISNTNVYFQISNCFLRPFVYWTAKASGIRLSHATNGHISSNFIFSGDSGIFISEGGKYTISDNIINYSYSNGITISEVKELTISDNNISNSYYDGITFSNSEKIIISGNNIFYNDYYGIDSGVYSSSNIHITNNSISNNGEGGVLQGGGISFHATNSTIVNNSIFNNLIPYNLGIEIWGDENTIANNTIFNNSGSGIEIGGDKNTITTNSIYNNTEKGIINRGGYNNIFANIISHNGREGIYSEFLGGSGPFRVAWNFFIGNNIGGLSQAFDYWSSGTFSHNYWDDWISPDANSDGIVDSPYFIDENNQDPYPLAVIHYLSKPTIVYPNGGETLSGIFTIRWDSSIDMLRHYITYTIHYSSDGGTSWTLLASSLKTTTHDWDTTTVSNGSIYLIKVIASCSEGLTAEDISDNTFTINNIIHSDESTTSTTVSTSDESTTSTTVSTSDESIKSTSLTGVIMILSTISAYAILSRKRKKE